MTFFPFQKGNHKISIIQSNNIRFEWQKGQAAFWINAATVTVMFELSSFTGHKYLQKGTQGRPIRRWADVWSGLCDQPDMEHCRHGAIEQTPASP